MEQRLLPAPARERDRHREEYALGDVLVNDDPECWLTLLASRAVITPPEPALPGKNHNTGRSRDQ